MPFRTIDNFAAPAMARRSGPTAGKVELSGFTQSQDDKDRAESIARTTAGVTGVHNDLEVRPQAQ